MKNLRKLLALCCLATFIFSSCKTNSETVIPSIQAESIVGKWKDGGTKGHIKIMYEGQSFTESINEVSTNDIVEFTSDGKIRNLSAPGKGPQFSKYTTKGDQLILVGTQANKTFEFIFTYKIVASQLTLSMDKKLFVKNIETFSKAGIDSSLDEFADFVTYITEIEYNHFMNRQ